MMKFVLYILLLITAIPAFSQPEDAVVKTIEGKKYYVHNVAQGNTLYGIHKLYKVEIEDILNANPGMSNELTIGQQILIPTGDNPLDNASKNVHVVQAGETLYGISRIYKCTVGDLKNLNPGIEEGVSIGQKINLPSSENNGEMIQADPIVDNAPEYQISFEDSIVRHTVLDHETLYSISKRYMVSSDTIRVLNQIKGNKVKKGDVLRIPIKKVNYEVLEKEILVVVNDSLSDALPTILKGEYNVALMLPFMFAQNDAEMSKTIKFGQIREMYPTTKIAFEFYQGFMLAIDSLKRAGLNVNIFVYDTKKDTAAVSQIFNKSEFESMDLVVGPLFPNTITHAADLCLKKEINIVLPFKTGPKVLHDNPYAFKAVTSNMTLTDGAVDYLLKEHPHHNIVILKPYLTSDIALYERAIDRFNNNVQPGAYNSKIVETTLGSSGGRELNSLLKQDTTNIIIIPSNDVKFVTGALNRLNKVLNMNPYAKKMRVIAFGYEDWNGFDDIDVLHRNRLNQHYTTYRYIDYNSLEGVRFVKEFRNNTGTDPTVFSSQGFDIGMYFMSALHLYGTNFQTALNVHELPLTQNKFNFVQISSGSGYENVSVSIAKFEDFQLHLCK